MTGCARARPVTRARGTPREYGLSRAVKLRRRDRTEARAHPDRAGRRDHDLLQRLRGEPDVAKSPDRSRLAGARVWPQARGCAHRTLDSRGAHKSEARHREIDRSECRVSLAAPLVSEARACRSYGCSVASQRRFGRSAHPCRSLGLRQIHPVLPKEYLYEQDSLIPGDQRSHV